MGSEPSKEIVGKPTLTVVLMNYNQAPYLRESYEAILSQSYRPLEIILIDDGSTDESLSIIQNLPGLERVRLVLNKANRGGFPSANEVLYQAKGDYIAYFAADDRIEPGLLEKSMKLLETYPQAALSFCEAGKMNQEGIQLAHEEPKLNEEAGYFSPLVLAQQLREKNVCGFPAAGSILKRSILVEFGGWREEWRWHSDWLIELIFGARQGICYLPETLASIRILPQSYSRKKSKKAQIEVLEKMADFVSQDRNLANFFRLSCIFQVYGVTMFLILLRKRGRWILLSLSYLKKIALRVVFQIVRILKQRWTDFFHLFVSKEKSEKALHRS